MTTPNKPYFPLGRWTREPQPFQDEESLRLASGNPALESPEDCKHSFVLAGRCSDRWRCVHCHKVFIFTD